MMFWNTRITSQIRQLAAPFNASECERDELVDAYRRFCAQPLREARVRRSADRHGARQAAIDSVIAMARYDKQTGDLTSSYPRGALLTWFMAKYFSTRDFRVAA